VCRVHPISARGQHTAAHATTSMQVQQCKTDVSPQPLSHILGNRVYIPVARTTLTHPAAPHVHHQRP
jgi:hypothetical protein